MAEKVLLINPAVTRRAYLETNVRVGAPLLPSLGLAAVAGAILSAGRDVRIVDLDLADVSGLSPEQVLAGALDEFAPDIVGLTSVTPSWHDMMDAARLVKRRSPSVPVAAGGVHASRFFAETLEGGAVDFVAVGEADFTLNDLLDAGAPAGVPGLAFMGNGAPVPPRPRPLIGNLDDLPDPAWELFETRRYRMSRLTERLRPSSYLETSRGCPFECVYCDKTAFGRGFRAKTPARVVEEMERMARRHGFRELHIVDDGFSTDMNRAKEICRLKIARGLTIPFNLFNGIRADRVDDELCALLRRAGCRQVAFGVESGNDAILEAACKGITTDTVRRAVALCKKHKLETFGFFMIGLPDDTEETVMDTIRFAVELDLTIAKFDVATPLPGTLMFDRLDSEGRILTRDWRRYILHRADTPLFVHPNMSGETIERLYCLAYRKTYLRAGYIAKRFIHGLRTAGLWHDAAYFLKTSWRMPGARGGQRG